MDALRALARRLKYWIFRDRMTADLEEEMRLHADLLSNAETGTRRFGNATELVERSRDEWGARWLDAVTQDVRHAMRSLRHSNAVTLVVIFTLAIVIGANAAIFGVMHAVFLQRLDLPHPEELRTVYAMRDGSADDINMAEYRDLQHAVSPAPLEAYWINDATIESNGIREDVWVDMVSGGFLPMLGVRPILGRVLTLADARAVAPVVVISEDVWSHHFGRDAAVVGKTMRVNGREATIVGVLPSSFHSIHFARTFSAAMPMSATMYAPRPIDTHLLSVFLVTRVPVRSAAHLRLALDVAYRSCCIHAIIDMKRDEEARLSVPPPGLQTQPEPVDAPTGIYQQTSGDKSPHVMLADASRGVRWSTDYRATYGRVLFGVGAGIAILLLIACANIATLLLARAVTREREFAVQLSMGAGRGRIVRQLLAESFALAAAGCIAGLFVAYAGTTFLVRHLPASASTLSSALAWRSSSAILLYTLATGTVCTLLFGAWPAVRAARTDLLTPLKTGMVSTSAGRGITLDRSLVVAQVALALVLLSTGSLLIRTLHNLSRPIDAGGGSTALITIDANNTRYQGGAIRLHHDVGTAMSTVAGVRDVATASDAPVIEDLFQNIKPRDPSFAPSRDQKVAPRLDVVSANYFDVANIPIAAGRAFTNADRVGAEHVAIVSESFARLYYGATNPVGQLIDMGYDSAMFVRIIGVAHDASYDDPRAAHVVMMYLPVEQTPETIGGKQLMMGIIMRTAGDPAMVLSAARTKLTSTIPDVRIARMTTVAAALDDALSRERLAAALAQLFGGIALLLVGVGVYGLLAHNTARRTHEIGVRMALGGRVRDAVWLVVSQSLALLGIGLGVGVPLAFLSGRLVRSQLFEVSASDPRMMLFAAALLLVAGLIASLLPGARAARVDPLEALRTE